MNITGKQRTPALYVVYVSTLIQNNTRVKKKQAKHDFSEVVVVTLVTTSQYVQIILSFLLILQKKRKQKYIRSPGIHLGRLCRYIIRVRASERFPKVAWTLCFPIAFFFDGFPFEHDFFDDSGSDVSQHASSQQWLVKKYSFDGKY